MLGRYICKLLLCLQHASSLMFALCWCLLFLCKLPLLLFLQAASAAVPASWQQLTLNKRLHSSVILS